MTDSVNVEQPASKDSFSFSSEAFQAYLGDVQTLQAGLRDDPIISKNPKFVFFPFSFLFLRD